jgi:hypothetical protein
VTRVSFRRAGRLAIALVIAAAMLSAASGTVLASTVIWNNYPSTTPGNVPSEGFECCSASEFGGQVAFAPGKWKNPKVTVLMSSWGCQERTGPEEVCVTQKGAKFEWPITISIYTVGPGNSPGTKIAAASKVFKIPYRPSTSTICNSTQNDKGGWYDKKEEACHEGLAAKIAIPLKVVELPQRAIITVSYNTSDYGLEPQRPKNPPCESSSAGCPFDSLNVGAESVLPESSFPLPDEAYINTTSEAEYCGSGTALGTLGLTGSEAEPCWQGYQPVMKVNATSAG